MVTAIKPLAIGAIAIPIELRLGVSLHWCYSIRSASPIDSTILAITAIKAAFISTITGHYQAMPTD